ncbi:hypothetical protein RugamoR64_08230 [Duganella rhizosphaerae]|uniref:BrnA antitoxin family protein n=1 Tax=Duganella rhizosphaerae TaxID=2885763 RepID=UPI0030EAEF1C
MNEAIDFSDIPELDDEFCKDAKMRPPLTQKDTVLLDHDIYEWFKSKGPDYQQRINLLLRSHIGKS